MEICDKGYEKLMIGIVKQAYVDLVFHLKKKYKLEEQIKNMTEGKEKHTRGKNLKFKLELECSKIKECERFFKGQWYQTLCEVDGEVFIAKAREDATKGERVRVCNTTELKENL